jgi:LysM repeat protein
MAAAMCFAPQAIASPAEGGSSYVVAVTTSAYQTGAPLAELSSTVVLDGKVKASKPAAAGGLGQFNAAHAAGTPTVWYTVKSGDSLSSIAGHVYHDSAAWPVLYWANKHQIQSADVIEPGQRLRVPAKPATIPAAPAESAPAPAAPVAAQSAPAATAPAAQSAPVAAASYTGSSSFQQCVIARESGGNSQAMNSSGHYGLYQFSASTWAAYGGNPADFGNASVAEQNQVFGNAVAAGGQSNWAPYDGC